MNRTKVFISTSGDESEGYLFADGFIKEIKYSNQLMDTTFDINPTIIEQYAEIVFRDKNHTIYDLVVNGTLTNDLKVFVYVDNILYQTYLTSSWDVQAQSSTITLHCNDETKKLENKQTQLINVQNRTLKQLVQYGFTWAGYSWQSETADVDSVLSSIVIPDSYVVYQDILTYLNKLCLVGFLRIFWNKNKFIVARCF